jgi:protein-S-isoprenylcysteine O-methyltransferase Ste14
MDGRLPCQLERSSGDLPRSVGLRGLSLIAPGQWISTGLLLACLISFGWAMRRFFVQPVGLTAGMTLIKTCGITFGILHVAAILATPDITIARGISGALIYLGALVLFWWSIKTSLLHPLSAAFSPDLPVHLVAHGPYRIIRHPLYCSYLLCWLAGWVVTGRLWLAPTVVVMLAIYLVAASREENKFMHSPLAEAYQQYRAQTGLFVPNPLKLYGRVAETKNGASLSPR